MEKKSISLIVKEEVPIFSVNFVVQKSNDSILPSFLFSTPIKPIKKKTST